jgi:hypothetical protein
MQGQRIPRSALIAAPFIVAALAYWVLSGHLDPAGAIMLIGVGVTMAFGFMILFRASNVR